jgi:SpoVK/Ycf46/Vps4 family AAA+-type ATPase
MDIMLQSTRELSLGHLVSVLNLAKISALEKEESLSCHHLAKAFHKLVIRCPKIALIPSTSTHACDFIFTTASGHGSPIDSFIGITNEHRETIQLLRESRFMMLIISGPIGSGKTYLANAIAYNPSCPFVTVTSADILRARIGETEKRLHKVLCSNSAVVIEDVDKLFPPRTEERVDESHGVTTHTGSVERCLPVLLSFLDTCGPNTTVIGTTRDIDQVSNRLKTNHRIAHVKLEGKLIHAEKIALIQCKDPLFEPASVNAFDLILVSNRSQCIQYAREAKMVRLRNAIAAERDGTQ